MKTVEQKSCEAAEKQYPTTTSSTDIIKRNAYQLGYVEGFESGKAEEILNTEIEIATLNVKVESLRSKLLESNDALQQCAEVLNLLASRAGIQTEDAALKSDAEDFGALAALRAAREVLNQYK